MRVILGSALKLLWFAALLLSLGYLCWRYSYLVSPRRRTAKPVALKTIYHVGRNQPWPTLRSAVQDLPTKTRRDRGNPPVRIIVEEDLNEDRVLIQGESNLTIEPAAGKKITWTVPCWHPVKPHDDPPKHVLLCFFQSVNVHLKGLTLDGNNQIDTLVLLSDYCPATSLEDVTLKGFKEHGIVTVGCEGDAEASRRVLLKRLTFQTSQPYQTGVLFTPGSRSLNNRFITFQDCKFNGPGLGIETTASLDFLSDIQFPAGVHPVVGPYSRR